MKKSPIILDKIIQIILNSSNKSKKKTLITIIIIVISAIIELIFIFGIGVFLNKILNNSDVFSIDISIKILSVIMFILVLINSILRFLSLKYQANTAHKIGEDISNTIFEKSISINYEEFTTVKSSEFVNKIALKCDQIITHAVLPFFNLFSLGITSILVIASLLIYNPKITLILFFILFSIYFIINKLTKNKLVDYGLQISLNTSKLVRLIQESCGSYRDILIDNSRKNWILNFSVIDEKIRKNKKKIHIIANLPKIIIEGFFLGLIFLALIITNLNDNDIKEFMPIFGVFIVALQRMLPIMQGGFSSLATIKSSESIVSEVVAQISKTNLKNISSEEIVFRNSLEFRDISFKYNNSTEFVLKNINFLIQRGQFICIQGKTGSGKTTLIDIVLGLLHPVSGKIFADEKEINTTNSISWMRNFSHVPQKVYLIDGSILDNIMVGIEQSVIDYKKLEFSFRIAELTDFINTLELGFNAPVGENGAYLSGGQIQRIGIARAIYRQSKIIVFDESTSALDIDTEKKILNNIKKLGITVIFISHSSRILSFCDKQFNVEKNSLVILN